MEFIQPLCEIWTPISTRVDYARNLSKNFRELSRRVKELCDRRDDIRDQIELVKLQKAPTRECNGWFANVDEIEKHVKMIEEEHLVDKRWFSDVIARVKLGKHMVEMMERVKELQEKSKFESGFVTDLPPAIVEKRPVDNLFMGNSTNLTLQKTLDSIRDEGVQKIGIWGMGGVGKTTLMNLLNNRPEMQTMFQIVIWVTVSKTWSIMKIQDEIAKRLSLEDSIMLCRKLEGMKYLLLLDDVWEWVDLSKVGIPSQEKGCKIVLTTRDDKVCRRMKTNVNIKVEVLDKKEAWEMFNSEAGQVVPTIKSIAEKIVEKCGGLPLALRVVGGALRMVEDVSVWRNFLNKLNSPASSYIEDMDEDVFKPLKVSYDELKDANTKKCFLYCGLYAEDKEIKISKLITYWRAEGFLLSKGSLEDGYDDGRAKVHDLIGASLLDKCKDENHVKMHDVVRDLVLKMTSSAAAAAGGEESSRFMVRTGLQIANDDDDKAEWEEASRISFMDAKGYKLPEMPKCTKLSTLLLQSRRPFHSLQKIPECFFNHMPNLRVLDVSGSGISTLPSSISNLVNLRALLLKNCEYFQAFPQEVSALQRLEVLHVSRTYRMYQPIQIWKLTSLKSLRFSPFRLFVCQVPTTPSVTISRLSLLEELSIKYIDGYEESWESFTKEVGSLTRLSSLKLVFRTKNGLEHFLHNSQAWRDGNIKKFTIISVGYCTEWRYLSKGYERCLLINAGGEGGVPCEINEVLIRSEFFHLESCGTVSDLGIDWEKVNGLKCLELFNCGLEYMVDGDGLRGNAFSNLEYLYLDVIRGLRGICYDRLPMQQQLSSSSSSNSFTKLQHLEIWDCHEMKKVFPWGLIPQLLNLELLHIDNCRELEEIISVDFDEDNRLEHMNLPKLKHLRLRYLPEFIGFSKRKRNHLYLHCPSLEEVTFVECRKLEIFPFGIDSAPNLRKIEGQLHWWEALKWEDDAIKARFSPLFFDIKMGSFQEMMRAMQRYKMGADPPTRPLINMFG